MNRERVLYYKFDEEQWKTLTTMDQVEKRYYMARYLINHDLLIAKSQPEILEMLGQPDSDSGYMYLYCLGPERGSFIQIDNDWLEIGFDGDGHVTSNRIRPD